MYNQVRVKKFDCTYIKILTGTKSKIYSRLGTRKSEEKSW
jgi:hypothetical protein